MASALVDQTIEPDDGTIRAAIRGDEAAFERLYEAHRRNVYRVARAITGDHELARDVVQETFIKVYRALASWRGDSSLATWIVRIAIREAIKHRKRALRHSPVHSQATEPSHDPRLTIDDALARARVHALATKLAGQQGLILRLRLLGGLSNGDIAKALALTESNVRMQVTKAVRRLRELL